MQLFCLLSIASLFGHFTHQEHAAICHLDALAGTDAAANRIFLTGPGTLTVLGGPASGCAGWAAVHGFGANPKDGSSMQPVTGIPAPADGSFSYPRRKASLSGPTPTVWTSSGLVGWTEDAEAGLAVVMSNGDLETVQVALSARLPAAPEFFVRILASWARSFCG